MAENIILTSVCGLGQTAPNPVLSTIRYFKNEYIEHIKDKKCISRQCKALLDIRIDSEKCKGCGICKKNCPADAIIGGLKNVHIIDHQKCIKCGTCITKCPFKAIK